MLKRLSDRRGFTILEMMLVMGIVAILSAIAIPAFMGYQAESKQTEAKVNLAGILISEHAYFTEHNFYTEDIMSSGFGFSGTSKYYDFTCATPAVISGAAPNITCSWVVGSWIGKHGTPGDGPGAGASFGLSDLPGAIGSNFTAIAVGNVNREGVYDIWEISDNGLLHCQTNAAVL